MAATDTPPTHPKSFGEELRRLRESSGLSIDDIAAETKVSNRVLEALESGMFQFLPEQIFSRNFVRQYARTIGYDEDRLVDAFDAAWERYQLSSGTHPALIVDEVPPGQTIRWGFWFPIAIAVVILLTVAWVILDGSEPGNVLTPDLRRGTAARSSSIRMPTQPPPVRLGVAGVPARGGLTQNGIEDLVTVSVQVEQGKECWIQYRDRDGVTGERLLRGGEKLELELKGPVKFTVGNAGAVTVRVGTTEYTNLGIPGQVIHTEISREGLVPLGLGEQHD